MSHKVGMVFSSPRPKLDDSSSRWVYLCFFLSGFNGLLYETAWLSRIQLVMGHTVYSLMTTLCAYLGGLGIGALLVPHIQRKSKFNGLALYLGAEVIIGIWGVLFLPILNLLKIPYSFFVSSFDFSLLGLSLVQFSFCSLLVLLPTLLMGATLPLLAGYLYPERNGISEKSSILYAINTIGAWVGSLATGFLILPSFGYSHSILLAAAINLALYFIVTFACQNQLHLENISRGPTEHFQDRAGEPSSDANSASVSSSLIREPRRIIHVLVDSSTENRWCWFALLVSGAVSMICQSVWGRLASLNFGASVYVFPIVTSVVLAGIAIGSLLWNRLISKRKHGSFAGQSKEIFSLLPLLAALSLAIGHFLFSRASYLVFAWFLRINPSFWLKSFLEVCLTSVCLLIPSILLGMIFPAAITQLSSGKAGKESSEALSIGYGINLIGLLLGAGLVTVMLLLEFDIEKIGAAGVLLLLIASVGLFWQVHGSWHQAIAGFSLGALVLTITPSFDWNLLTRGFFYNRDTDLVLHVGRVASLSEYLTYMEEIFTRVIARRDDPHATVSIHQGKHDLHYRSFRVDGKVDGTTTGDDSAFFAPIFPAFFKTDMKSALVIGLGIGYTARSVLDYPKIENLKVIELSSAVIDFSKKYLSGKGIEHLKDAIGDRDLWVRELWENPKFHVINRDGREFLEHTQENFDLIISEPSNPWVNGVSSLFTQEFYQSVSEHLNPGGIASLWFHSYGLNCRSVYSVISAAASVFKSLYVFKIKGDIFMIGSNEPSGLVMKKLPPELKSMERRFFSSEDLREIAASSEPYHDFLLKTFMYDHQGVERYLPFAKMNQDDNQFLQYESGKTFFLRESCMTLTGWGDATSMSPLLQSIGP